MTGESKCAVYARVGTEGQTNTELEQKLEAIQLLQEIGYQVAVAPVSFSGAKNEIKQVPTLKGLSSCSPEMKQARDMLRGEYTLVINGDGNQIIP